MSKLYVEVSVKNAEELKRKENLTIKRIKSMLQVGVTPKFDKKTNMADVDSFHVGVGKLEDQLNVELLEYLVGLSESRRHGRITPNIKYDYLKASKRALEDSVSKVKSSPLSCDCQFCSTDVDILIRNISAPLYFSDLGLLVFPDPEHLLNSVIAYFATVK